MQDEILPTDLPTNARGGVIVHMTSGRRIEAIATTDHPVATAGHAVVLLDGEPIGPGDMVPVFDDGELVGVESIREVEVGDLGIASALRAAGYSLRQENPPKGASRKGAAARSGSRAGNYMPSS